MKTTLIKVEDCTAGMMFDAESVAGFLSHRKTQTRRRLQLGNCTILGRFRCRDLWDQLRWDVPDLVRIDDGPDPFGHAGYQYLHVPASDEWPPKPLKTFDDVELWYRVRPAADLNHWYYAKTSEQATNRMFMKREDAKYKYRINGIRVQRLHDITEDDAQAEGVAPIDMYDPWDGCLPPGSMSYREGYAARWDAINGKKCPWRINPWVWVYDIVDFSTFDMEPTR